MTISETQTFGNHCLARREFIKMSISAGTAAVFGNQPSIAAELVGIFKPLAITMWDFSWLERRWPGAGYEDWDQALSELTERGYNAVRIDAYPHLIAEGAEKIWTLRPQWNVQDWGSPALCKVQVMPALCEFIGKCRNYGVRVGLSTWYREDLDNVRMKISGPEVMARQWLKTLNLLEKEGLLDTVFYVDLCNEWPGDAWAPYFRNDPPELTWGAWNTAPSMKWMRESIELVRKEHPVLPLGFSFDAHKYEKAQGLDLSFIDYAEPHIWMAQANGGEYYNKVGYKYDRFKHDSYEAQVERGEAVYREKPDYWKGLLTQAIKDTAGFWQTLSMPLMTTECWGVVDYKDWPLLNWDWVMELCKLGAETASASRQWVAIATSNFCGPQFKGVWKQKAWHQTLTRTIKNGTIHPELMTSKLVKRIAKKQDSLQ